MNNQLRPDLDLYFMRMARQVATRSTCLRRAVGCVLVGTRGRVLSTGYNGVARGAPHCNEATGFEFVYADGIDKSRSLTGQATGRRPVYGHACNGAMESGGSLELCGAVHAEQNALLQCRDADAISFIYVTIAPCDSCLKLLLNTGATRLVVGGWWRDNQEAIRKRWDPKELVFEARE